MSLVRGAPFRPQTQGKIERWRRTPKNLILLENHFLPGDLEVQVEAIVGQRKRIKRKTIEYRHLRHRKPAA